MASSDIRNSLALKKVDNHIWTSDETRLEQGHGARGVFGGRQSPAPSAEPVSSVRR
jgi:hypothetical protein